MSYYQWLHLCTDNGDTFFEPDTAVSFIFLLTCPTDNILTGHVGTMVESLVESGVCSSKDRNAIRGFSNL